MSSKPKEDIEISKNLLQMNFMRRTAIAREKANGNNTDEVVDPDKWNVKLPDRIKAHMNMIRESKPTKQCTFNYLPSLFSVLNIPAGNRLSFRGFNPTVERQMANQAALLAESYAETGQPEVSIGDDEMARRLSSIKRKTDRMNKKRPSKKNNQEDLEDGELIKKRHKSHHKKLKK